MSDPALTVYDWVGRLAMCLAVVSQDLPDHLQTHVRKTVDEFLRSDLASDSLANMIRPEIKR